MANEPTSRRMSRDLTETLEAEVMAGRLRPGDKLPSESVLGDRFQVSRTVVRDAMQALSAKGLIETRKGSGSYVAEQKRDQLSGPLRMYSALIRDERMFAELLELRMAVESACARRAAARWTDAKQLILTDLLARMEEKVDDLAAFTALDLEFHLEISRMSENSLFIDLMGALLPQIGQRFMENTYAPDEPGLTRRVLRQHQAVHDALVSKDPARAEEAMLDHLASSTEHFEQMVREGRLVKARRRKAV